MSIAVVEAARGCLGTPYEHQGRTPHVGLDCVGLVLVGLRAAGLAPPDVRTYAPQPRPGGELFRHVRAVLGPERAPGNGMEDTPGAVLGFALRGEPYHLGIRTDRGIIHCLAPRGQGDSRTRVKEHEYDARWRRRTVAVWEVAHG